jgi:thiamine biosynthesis protein ThiI
MLISLPFSVYQVGTPSVPQNYEPVVFRAFIRKVAETMAYRFEALAISTGDNLGQVASQTLYNLASIDRDATLPILRPLLAFDKTEIVDLASSIGTYELSIAEYKDCCALLSRHPRTRADPETVQLLLSRLNTDKMIAEMIAGGSLTVYEPADDSISSCALDQYFRPRMARAPEQV